VDGAPVQTESHQASVVILALSGLTLALGFAFQVVLAAKVGAGREMDIYLVAITLPTAAAALAITVLPATLVPLIKARLASPGSQEWHGFFASAAGFAAVIAAVLVVPLELAARPVVRMVAPGFDPEAVAAAAWLLRLMLIGSWFDAIRGVQSAAFYAQERFWQPQLAPSLKHVVMLASAVWLLPKLGLPGLALGWTLGSVAMWLALDPASVLPKTGSAGRGLSAPPAVRSFRLAVPVLMVALLGQVTPLIDRLVASMLAPGSISYLGYGAKIMEVMLRTTPMAVALALFPRLSAQAGAAEWPEFGRTISAGLRKIALTSVPLAVAVVMLCRPLVIVLFQRGVFDATATAGVATAVGWYAVAFVPAAAAGMLAQAIYATQRAWTLAAITAGAVAVNIGLDFLLAKAVGFAGVAIAFVAVSTMLCFALLGVVRGDLAAVGWSDLRRACGEVMVAVAAMAATLLVWSRLAPLGARPGAQLAFAVAGRAGLALAMYVVVLLLVGNAEVRWAAGRVHEMLVVRPRTK
jgi:putative peptidoglycan lipid II flippase